MTEFELLYGSTDHLGIKPLLIRFYLHYWLIKNYLQKSKNKNKKDSAGSGHFARCRDLDHGEFPPLRLVLGEDAAQDFDRCVPIIVDATTNCSVTFLIRLLIFVT